MFGLFKKKNWEQEAQQILQEPDSSGSIVPTVSVDALPDSGLRYKHDDGTKFSGGYGPTNILLTDYWTLRARSAELFETNLYARGIIRRLVTNIINTGLHLEATPEEALLGFGEDELAEWAEDVENRFHLWEKDPKLCHHGEQLTFGAVQQLAELEASVVGDVLVVLQQDRRTGLPRAQLIDGARVRTPIGNQAALGGKLPNGNRIIHGVELDQHKRHVAYWILQDDLSAKRLPAYGEKSGRRLAWLYYGTDKRLDDVRGKPILSTMLQSLKEIDRYRDSVQRKAVINSMLAMFIKKTQDKPGTRPITATAGGAVRKTVSTVLDNQGDERSFKVTEQIPGVVMEELQQGEEPHGFMPNGTDEKFGDFEASIIQTIAWHLEIPPEILMLSFTNNYSASQAAINEFKMFLNVRRTRVGEQLCQPIYQEWLISEALNQRVAAPRLLEAWRNPAMYDVAGSWFMADWTGHIKPAVDMSKLVRAYADAADEGFITRDRAARELTGTKYSKNVKKLKKENEQLADALEVLPENQKPPVAAEPANAEDPDKADQDESKKGRAA